MEMLYIYNYINMFEEKSLLSNYFGALAWNLESFREAAVFKASPLSSSPGKYVYWKYLLITI